MSRTFVSASACSGQLNYELRSRATHVTTRQHRLACAVLASPVMNILHHIEPASLLPVNADRSSLGRRAIALIAHDAQKTAMLELVQEYRDALHGEQLIATGTTGGLIAEQTGLAVQCLASGPLGGDLQIGAQIGASQVKLVISCATRCARIPMSPTSRRSSRCATSATSPWRPTPLRRGCALKH